MSRPEAEEEIPSSENLEAQVRFLKEAHEAAANAAAKATILEALRAHQDFVAEQDSARDAYVQGLSATLNRTEHDGVRSGASREGSTSAEVEDLVVVPVTQRTRHRDVLLESLNDILQARDSGVAQEQMPHIEQLPRYIAWIPVLHNFFVTETDIDPFFPYFGDQKKEREKADEVYNQMRRDKGYGSESDSLSDGEIGEDGTAKSPSNIIDYMESLGLKALRRRAAQRHAVMEITRRCGTGDRIWEALSAAFEIPDIRRLHLICDVAERRNVEARTRSEQREKHRKKGHALRSSVFLPETESAVQVDFDDGQATDPLKSFCFCCHAFACHFHEGESVAPVLPIPDRAAESRKVLLHDKRGAVEPCSQRCFLLETWRQVPVGIDEGKSWTAEETLLLREAVVIFQEDPCGLSVVIGTKSCREVWERISVPSEAQWIKAAIQLSKKPRDPASQHQHKESAVSSDDDDEPIARRRTKRRPRRERRVIKSVCQGTKKSGSKNETRDKRHIPCNHYGSCSKESACSCAMRALKCESLCGCNCGRYVEGEKGMYWQRPTEREFRNEIALRCSRRVMGCTCTGGNCIEDDCSCYKDRRVCNPDFCESCGCNVLPSKLSVRERRCRNSELITSRHKQTFIGRSAVHGYGLFAAEHFAEGELVGPYCGRIMEPNLLDKALRVSQAGRETFAFNVLDTLTIDGGALGSKVKFINHTDGDPNCFARCERVRGEGRIALKTIRPVRPGEEFLFDYNIIADEGNGWLTGGDQPEDEDPSEEDDDADSEEDDADSQETDEVSILGGCSTPTFGDYSSPRTC